MRSALQDLLWRSWTQIGLSGSIEGSDERVIDPEVLLILTLRSGSHDPRLFDETLDWLAVNGRSISVQRLRNLTTRDETARIVVDAALDWAGSQEPSLAAWTRRATQRPQSEITLAPIRIRRPDPIFRRHGVLWPRVERSGNSASPDPKDPAAFAFLLRTFFGIGSRAEIVRVLLTDFEGPHNAARLARLTAYAKRNVQESLSALIEAGPVSVERIGNEFHYGIHAEGWMEIFDIPTGQPWPRFFDWVALLDAVSALMPWLDSRAEADLSDYLAASKGREAVGAARQGLSALGIRLGPRLDAKGESLLMVLDRIVEELIGSFMGVGDTHQPSLRT